LIDSCLAIPTLPARFILFNPEFAVDGYCKFWVKYLYGKELVMKYKSDIYGRNMLGTSYIIAGLNAKLI